MYLKVQILLRCQAAGIDVSGVSNAFFPKSGGKGSLTTAAAAVGLGLAATSAAARARTANTKAFQRSGGDLQNALSQGQQDLFGGNDAI